MVSATFVTRYCTKSHRNCAKAHYHTLLVSILNIYNRIENFLIISKFFRLFFKILINSMKKLKQIQKRIFIISVSKKIKSKHFLLNFSLDTKEQIKKR